MKKLFLSTVCTMALSTSLFGYFYIDDVMSEDEQQKTGVYNLTMSQKQELEKWLNENFTPANKAVAATPEEPQPTLTFDVVLSGGKFVQLSDGTLYEIAPDDMQKTALWLIPFPIEVKDSGDPDYPLMLVNKNTGEGVKAKKATAAPSQTTPPAPTP